MKKHFISVDESISLIKNGEVVAIPTETVYGLAGSIFHEKALKQIFHLKKRPFFNPLIVHCCDSTQMKQFHRINEPILEKMISHFCPGPITFILDKTDHVHPLVTAHHSKVGIRIPKHPLTLKLIQKTGLALCAPSANLFGQLSPSSAEQVNQIFKGEVPVLDGGPCEVGIESTVIEPDFKNHSLTILRPGMISKKHLILWLQSENLNHWTVNQASSPLSPGQLSRHYRPSVPLILIETTEKKPDLETVKTFLNKTFPQKTIKQLQFKSSAELTARWLYHDLNILSKDPSHIIYTIKPVQPESQWQAIWDRLDKASTLKLKYKNQKFC